MPADLDSLTARVAACLQDVASLVYPLEAIAEGLRQALAELSSALDRTMTLAGLDEVEETTLPDALESLVVQAAAAVVVGGRALRHAEQPDLVSEGLSPAALSWAEAAWNCFKRSCDHLRTATLRGEQVPWMETGWSLDGHDGEVF